MGFSRGLRLAVLTVAVASLARAATASAAGGSSTVLPAVQGPTISSVAGNATDRRSLFAV